MRKIIVIAFQSSFYTTGKALLYIALLLAFLSTQMISVKATIETTVRVEPYASTARVGEFFTVNVTVADVQNLYGLEITLRWDSSILQISTVDVRLGVESYPDGVLHEPIFIAENETGQKEGEYWLSGTSMDPAPPFNGSGNIVRITFKVINMGDSKLDLESKLSDWPPPDRDPRISWSIEHATIDGFFDMSSPIIGTPIRDPSGDVLPGQPVKVSVNVTDSASGVKNVTLLYTTNNWSTWETLPMYLNSSIDFYEATIPAQQAETQVKFKIIAYDYAGNLQIKNGESSSCTYFVVPEFADIKILLPLMVLIVFIIIANKILVVGKLTRHMG